MPRKKLSFTASVTAETALAEENDRYDEERCRQWLSEIFDRPYVPLVWTAEYVAERLVEAFTIARRIPGFVGPKLPQTAWRKDVVHTRKEIEEADRNNADDKLRQRPVKPTMVEIARMEEAIAWPGRFLINDADAASCVVCYADWHGQGIDVDAMAARFYYAGNLTFHVKRRAGFAIIAEGLNSSGDAVS